MRRITQSRLSAMVRMVWLVATLGLAGLVATALLFGTREVMAARTALPATQPPVGTVLAPTVPTTTLLVGTSPDYWPMEYLSGTQIVGHDIDLMNAVAVEMNVNVVYTSVPWHQIFSGVIAGEHDAVISSVSVTPAREELVDFTLPYLASSTEDSAVDDNVAIVVQKGNRRLRRQINEALWRLRNDGTLAAIIADIAIDVPEGHPHLPDWPNIAPGAGNTLVYTDTRQGITIIQVPSKAVSETILLAYTPVNTATPPSGLSFADRAFDLDVYRNGTFLSSGIGLSVPATITIHYTETDVIRLDEESLVLGRWGEATSAWEDAACGPYGRHPDENWLAVPVCHLSRFALFGETEHSVYLPLVLRNAP